MMHSVWCSLIATGSILFVSLSSIMYTYFTSTFPVHYGITITYPEAQACRLYSVLSKVAAAVTAAFPPRGGIRLLALEHTRGDRSALERLIGQEYILDSILYFDGDRVESAVRLANGATLKPARKS